MENVVAVWKLADYYTVSECVHADDALQGLELVNLFVVRIVLHLWNQTIVIFELFCVLHLLHLILPVVVGALERKDLAGLV